MLQRSRGRCGGGATTTIYPSTKPEDAAYILQDSGTVMVFAEGNLEGVVVALERGFARSFWLGLAGQVVLLPALFALVLGLAITVLGLLLIPFAIVSYVIAAAGLVSLFISQPLGRVLKPTVAVVCAVMAIAGGLLMARADALRDTDRDLSPAEQANLARAVSQFPNARFEVFTAYPDSETRSLAA